MKNFRFYEITVGILAGLFAAIIGIVITSIANIAPYLSFFLGCFISLPIFVSAFSLGTLSSLAALISATAILVTTNSVYIGFSFMLLFFLPAVYASWLLGLAKPTQEKNSLIWYPLSSVIFLLTNFIALISTFIGFYIQNHPNTPIIAQEIAENVVQAMRQSKSIDENDILAFSDLITTHIATLTAIALVIYSLIFLIGNLYFSIIIAQRMQWLARPRDDWRQTFRLPISGLAIFIIICITSVIEFGSIFDLSIRVFTTAYTIIISISGLAYLHNITQGINSRIIILSLVYIAILTVVFAPPIFFVILLMGIWATIQYNNQSLDRLY
ncbi:hypothetical protein H704_00452 [Bartonella bacilliformis Peru38]|uniref:DUF2232 domain-containing protein n=2 Tax=Bartonella bacilliformis TaxID=774 RepID=A0ABN0II69_BARBA|nr:hypothetical protein [Bartonella bacilliformis]ABM45299.1 putative membrane protein [Bartonella bacilliformis KC583]AMG85640.1 hypothetical protein AL467_02390 [Bartonella bacilliformis]EKS45057.1 hypothetical protein BbINS_02294 [Bartonella bacilliformis INS]EYS90064.1 hypothetical protein X472_00518 [Bartonella bacilliformis San Pedro600-02]EYS95033.1 hypothetical protein X470_00545 [Bartonella bacilliformis Peru-18]